MVARVNDHHLLWSKCFSLKWSEVFSDEMKHSLALILPGIMKILAIKSSHCHAWISKCSSITLFKQHVMMNYNNLFKWLFLKTRASQQSHYNGLWKPSLHCASSSIYLDSVRYQTKFNSRSKFILAAACYHEFVVHKV